MTFPAAGPAKKNTSFSRVCGQPEPEAEQRLSMTAPGKIKGSRMELAHLADQRQPLPMVLP